MSGSPVPAAGDLLAGIVLGAALTSRAALQRLRALPRDAFGSSASDAAWRALREETPAAERVKAAIGVAAVEGEADTECGRVMEAVWKRLDEIGARRKVWREATRLRVLAEVKDKAALVAELEATLKALKGEK